jgi:hypothetical protein
LGLELMGVDERVLEGTDAPGLDFDGAAANPQVTAGLIKLLLTRFDDADADTDQQY